MRLTDLLLSCILLSSTYGYEVEITRKESLRNHLIKAGKQLENVLPKQWTFEGPVIQKLFSVEKRSS